jgi:hypothetical protein
MSDKDDLGPMERRLALPPEGISDMQLYSSNCCTREEIEHQNKMIDWRNEQRRKRVALGGIVDG